ncbi:Nitroreductase [Hahella chejuensis KCTC 2396]|uniref:Putative NAD(P)H nitroreductase n=1 Tax=Hahella chejuensis (strain KCTC 2396) TaxID=349521 RepID=Q2SDT7_HAHCH|nr:nitroreductase family protein [Hahella chejuensis]ABC31187.1 Nitroreductase [Hahella chejuensis KCTC 2396]
MAVLDILVNRTSTPLLQAPAPSHEELRKLYPVIMRAPDHGRLRPCRLIIVEGEGLDALGRIYGETAEQDGQDDAARQKLAKAPSRAPMVIVVVATVQEHPKAPELEQLISAGCSAYALMLGLEELGYGAMWRTGWVAYDERVKQRLGLASNEHVVGYLYVGTPASKEKKVPEPPAFEERVSFFTGEPG